MDCNRPVLYLDVVYYNVEQEYLHESTSELKCLWAQAHRDMDYLPVQVTVVWWTRHITACLDEQVACPHLEGVCSRSALGLSTVLSEMGIVYRWDYGSVYIGLQDFLFLWIHAWKASLGRLFLDFQVVLYSFRGFWRVHLSGLALLWVIRVAGMWYLSPYHSSFGELSQRIYIKLEGSGWSQRHL